MPGDLISGYLACLGGRLPAGVTEEIADAREHYLASGLSGQDAERAAVAEFGDPGRLAAELTRHAPGRRAARILLATGPPAGACWAAALITSRAWTWPVPAAARLAFAVGLLVTVAALGAAAAGRTSYRRTRLAAPAGAGLILLDAAMVTAALAAAPAVTGVLAAAVAASLIRTALAARLVPRVAAG